VVKAVAELQAAHPELRFTHAYDNVAAVQENFDGSMQLLYEGALLAVLVVWWFLRDWRATLVAALALPLSVIPTFLGMAWFGFTLNTVTLLSLALVVGILVDDAIVEIENIVRHLRMGKTPCRRPWKPPTRSAWRSSPPPSRWWRCSCPPPSWPASPASSSSSSAGPRCSPSSPRWWWRACSPR
jgi:Cu/Ag efflux pump CusA